MERKKTFDVRLKASFFAPTCVCVRFLRQKITFFTALKNPNKLSNHLLTLSEAFNEFISTVLHVL